MAFGGKVNAYHCSGYFLCPDFAKLSYSVEGSLWGGTRVTEGWVYSYSSVIPWLFSKVLSY